MLPLSYLLFSLLSSRLNFSTYVPTSATSLSPHLSPNFSPAFSFYLPPTPRTLFTLFCLLLSIMPCIPHPSLHLSPLSIIFSFFHSIAPLSFFPCLTTSPPFAPLPSSTLHPIIAPHPGPPNPQPPTPSPQTLTPPTHPHSHTPRPDPPPVSTLLHSHTPLHYSNSTLHFLTSHTPSHSTIPPLHPNSIIHVPPIPHISSMPIPLLSWVSTCTGLYISDMREGAGDGHGDGYKEGNGDGEGEKR